MKTDRVYEPEKYVLDGVWGFAICCFCQIKSIGGVLRIPNSIPVYFTPAILSESVVEPVMYRNGPSSDIVISMTSVFLSRVCLFASKDVWRGMITEKNLGRLAIYLVQALCM